MLWHDEVTAFDPDLMSGRMNSMDLELSWGGSWAMNEDAAMRMCKPIPFLLDCVARAWAVKGAAGCNYFFVRLAKNLKSVEKMVILGAWQKRLGHEKRD